MIETLGFDLSIHRAQIKPSDFDKLLAAGARFMSTRVSLGNPGNTAHPGYLDTTAKKFLGYADQRGLIRTGFHFFVPTPDTNAIQDGQQQAELYLSGLPPVPLDGHFLDLEVSGVKQGHVMGFAERIRRAGLTLGVYSRPSWWKSRYRDMPWMEELFDYQWWAYYTKSHTLDDWHTPPEEAEDRPGRMWQYGYIKDPGNFAIDGNVFVGKRAQMLKWLGAR